MFFLRISVRLVKPVGFAWLLTRRLLINLLQRYLMIEPLIEYSVLGKVMVGLRMITPLIGRWLF
jgi:hypothetical protein